MLLHPPCSSTPDAPPPSMLHAPPPAVLLLHPGCTSTCGAPPPPPPPSTPKLLPALTHQHSAPRNKGEERRKRAERQNTCGQIERESERERGREREASSWKLPSSRFHTLPSPHRRLSVPRTARSCWNINYETMQSSNVCPFQPRQRPSTRTHASKKATQIFSLKKHYTATRVKLATSRVVH